MPEVKLKFEQAQIPGRGTAVLWMCNPEHEHLANSAMHHNLWWILKEALDVAPGRVRFYESGAFQSPQCEHVSWCNDPDEIIASMENSEFESCVVYPLEYLAQDPAQRILQDIASADGKTIHHYHNGGSWERAASSLVETAHRLGINVVIISLACPYRHVQREYMPYLENVVPEMDLVIADRGEDVQIRTPAGKLLAEKSWKDITEAPLLRFKPLKDNK